VRLRRPGFTFVEILMSMAVIAILAGIVIPKTGDFIKRAKAAAVVGDIVAIRDGVYNYYTDSSAYPLTGAMGEVPPALISYLPIGFSFVKTDYSLQYNNWPVSQTIPGYPSTTGIIGITVETTDPRVGQLVQALLANWPQFQSGQNYTFIIFGL